MDTLRVLEVTDRTPIMLRRLERMPPAPVPGASFASMVTSSNAQPEVTDQVEDDR